MIQRHWNIFLWYLPNLQQTQIRWSLKMERSIISLVSDRKSILQGWVTQIMGWSLEGGRSVILVVSDEESQLP